MSRTEEHELNAAQLAAYLKSPNACPFCRSSSYEGDAGEWGDNAHQGLRCNTCGRSWSESYVRVMLHEDNGLSHETPFKRR